MEQLVTIPPKHVLIGTRELEGSLVLPPQPQGLVVFAHGSGSSRRSVRNIWVASQLHEQQFGTLLFDLLTEHEAADRQHVFDTELLGQRMVDAIEWIGRRPVLRDLPVGLFGASTGAAGALIAAATRPQQVFAVVSRGGRPDLAAAALPQVVAPTLLIVGGDDADVLALNRRALARLPHGELAVVPGATHLFEERGALEQVAQLAARWFSSHLPAVERKRRHG